MTLEKEQSAEAIQLELDALNTRFLACLTNQEFDHITAINEKISSLEAKLVSLRANEVAVESSDDDPVINTTENLTAAETLIAELERNSVQELFVHQNFSVAATDKAPAKTAFPADKNNLGLLAVKQLGLAPQPVASSQKARESMLKAAKRAQQREREEAAEIKKSDDELAEALLVKQMVDHTTSFLNLFLNPSKFIAKQLERENKSQSKSPKAEALLPSRDKASLSSSFEASPEGDSLGTAAIELQNKLEKFCFYELLSVSQTASSEEIGRAYLTKLKNLRARFQEKKDLQEWQLKQLLRALNRAGQVLGDSSSRKQYDLSLLGIHDFEKYPVEKVSTVTSTTGNKSDTSENNSLLSLSQLLIIAGLISTEELAEAEAKGNTVNDRRLIEHLIDTQLASFDEISAVILAQTLVARNRLSMSQFKMAMKELRSNSVRFVDTLAAEGWLLAEDLPANN